MPARPAVRMRSGPARAPREARSAKADSSRGGAQPESRECEDASSRTNRCRSRHGRLMATTVTPRVPRRAHTAGTRVSLSDGRVSRISQSDPGTANARASTVPSTTQPQPDRRRSRRAQEVARCRQVGAASAPGSGGPGSSSSRRFSVVLSLLVGCRRSSTSHPGSGAPDRTSGRGLGGQTKRFDLELKIALEEQPSAVIAAARAQGMIVPSDHSPTFPRWASPLPSPWPTRRVKDPSQEADLTSGSSKGSVANRRRGTLEESRFASSRS